MSLTRWPRALSSLASRDFRWFTISQLAGTTANWMEVIVRSIIIYDLSTSAVMLGVVNLARTLPSFVFGFIGGVLADRLDRRTLLTVSQLVSGSTAAILGALVFTGRIQVWHFFAAALIEGTVSSLQHPARQALIPSVVPREHLMNAIALSGGIWNASRTVGPALVGGAAAIAGPWAALFLEATFYWCGALATRCIGSLNRPDNPAEPQSSTSVDGPDRHADSPRRSGGFLEDFRGYSYLWENRIVGWLVALAMVPVFFSMGLRILAPIFAKEILHMGAGGVGLLLAAPGVGAIIATFIIAMLSNLHRKGIISLGGVIVHGLAVIVFALSDNLWITLTALAVHGFAMTAYHSLNQTLAQLHTDDEYRGRVMAVYATDRALHPVSGVVVALLADLWSAPIAVSISGAGCVIFALIVGIKSPTIRHLD